MKHLFIIDPLQELNLAFDTTLRLASALQRLGDEVYFCQVQDLGIDSRLGAFTYCYKATYSLTENKIEIHEKKKHLLGDFAVIQMRKDPPLDSYYMAATWVLDRVPKKVFVINHPNSLRQLNEKLLILEFPDYTCPSLITSNPEEIFAFAQTNRERNRPVHQANEPKDRENLAEIVIKPLGQFGGRGVERLNLSIGDKSLALRQIESVLASQGLNQGELKIVQMFNPQIFEGELRIFVFGKKIVASCLKVPQNNSFLANTGHGAILRQPDQTQIQRIEGGVIAIMQRLITQGVYMAGFDIIGTSVSEINITSPRLLATPLLDSYFDTLANLVKDEVRLRKY